MLPASPVLFSPACRCWAQISLEAVKAVQGVGDQVKISGAYCCYVALATAVLHGLGRMGVPVERDKADLGPVVV